MTACSKHPGTLAGANLRELLAECERLLGQVDQLRAAESDQFELIDALARDIDTDAVKLANEALLKLRLALPQSRRD